MDHSRIWGLRVDKGTDIWPVECLQERGPAPGWPHGLAAGGPVVKIGPDVPFEPSELMNQRGLMCAEAVCRAVDGGEGHGDLEPAQPVPALQAAFDGAADIPGVSLPSLVIIGGKLCTPGAREVMSYRRAAS